MLPTAKDVVSQSTSAAHLMERAVEAVDPGRAVDRELTVRLAVVMVAEHLAKHMQLLIAYEPAFWRITRMTSSAKRLCLQSAARSRTG